MKLCFLVFLLIAASGCYYESHDQYKQKMQALKNNIETNELYSKEISELFKGKMEDFAERAKIFKWYNLEKNLFHYYNSLKMDSNNLKSIDSLNYNIDIAKKDCNECIIIPRKIQNKKFKDSFDFLCFKSEFLTTIIQLQLYWRMHITEAYRAPFGYQYIFIPQDKDFKFKDSINIDVYPIKYFDNHFLDSCTLSKDGKVLQSQIVKENNFRYKVLFKGKYHFKCECQNSIQDSLLKETMYETLEREIEFEVK